MRVLHLLWALPIALFCQYWAFAFATIAWCGFSECDDLRPFFEPRATEAIAVLVVAAVVSAAVLGFAPWTTNGRLRAVAAPSFALAVAAISFAAIVWPR